MADQGIPRSELELLKRALSWGLLSSDQARFCIQHLTDRARAGQRRPLADFLLREGLLTRQEIFSMIEIGREPRRGAVVSEIIEGVTDEVLRQHSARSGDEKEKKEAAADSGALELESGSWSVDAQAAGAVPASHTKIPGRLGASVPEPAFPAPMSLRIPVGSPEHRSRWWALPAAAATLALILVAAWAMSRGSASVPVAQGGAAAQQKQMPAEKSAGGQAQQSSTAMQPAAASQGDGGAMSRAERARPVQPALGRSGDAWAEFRRAIQPEIARRRFSEAYKKGVSAASRVQDPRLQEQAANQLEDLRLLGELQRYLVQQIERLSRDQSTQGLKPTAVEVLSGANADGLIVDDGIQRSHRLWAELPVDWFYDLFDPSKLPPTQQLGLAVFCFETGQADHGEELLAQLYQNHPAQRGPVERYLTRQRGIEVPAEGLVLRKGRLEPADASH